MPTSLYPHPGVHNARTSLGSWDSVLGNGGEGDTANGPLVAGPKGRVDATERLDKGTSDGRDRQPKDRPTAQQRPAPCGRVGVREPHLELAQGPVDPDQWMRLHFVWTEMSFIGKCLRN